jgi:hypothetical protein
MCASLYWCVKNYQKIDSFILKKYEKRIFVFSKFYIIFKIIYYKNLEFKKLISKWFLVLIISHQYYYYFSSIVKNLIGTKFSIRKTVLYFYLCLNGLSLVARKTITEFLFGNPSANFLIGAIKNDFAVCLKNPNNEATSLQIKRLFAKNQVPFFQIFVRIGSVN